MKTKVKYISSQSKLIIETRSVPFPNHKPNFFPAEPSVHVSTSRESPTRFGEVGETKALTCGQHSQVFLIDPVTSIRQELFTFYMSCFVCLFFVSNSWNSGEHLAEAMNKNNSFPSVDLHSRFQVQN